jgi:hypothetical protein
MAQLIRKSNTSLLSLALIKDSINYPRKKRTVSNQIKFFKRHAPDMFPFLGLVDPLVPHTSLSSRARHHFSLLSRQRPAICRLQRAPLCLFNHPGRQRAPPCALLMAEQVLTINSPSSSCYAWTYVSRHWLSVIPIRLRRLLYHGPHGGKSDPSVLPLPSTSRAEALPHCYGCCFSGKHRHHH